MLTNKHLLCQLIEQTGKGEILIQLTDETQKFGDTQNFLINTHLFIYILKGYKESHMRLNKVCLVSALMEIVD